ncbi:MAG: CsgG/HfaB family protein [Hyphomonadaceae bacterium]
MGQIIKTLTLAAAAAAAMTGAAVAQTRDRGRDLDRDEPVVVPTCTRSLGAITLVDGDRDGWRAYNLSSPQAMLRVVVNRSRCFTIVERGIGMDVAQGERNLAAQGDLQRGQNMGRGQMRTADYVLIAEVAASDNNAGGSAVAGVLGGLIGGGLGAVVGGVRQTRQEAQAVLSLTNVRTTETVAVTEGRAQNRNWGWGGGAGGVGSTGFGGVVGGGWEDTDIGRVVSAAFIDAYAQMVTELGGLDPNATQTAPPRAFVTRQSTNLRSQPNTSSRIVRALPAGAMVYPSGAQEGMWWEVHDENDNQGWIRNDLLEPMR